MSVLKLLCGLDWFLTFLVSAVLWHSETYQNQSEESNFLKFPCSGALWGTCTPQASEKSGNMKAPSVAIRQNAPCLPAATYRRLKQFQPKGLQKVSPWHWRAHVKKWYWSLMSLRFQDQKSVQKFRNLQELTPEDVQKLTRKDTHLSWHDLLAQKTFLGHSTSMIVNDGQYLKVQLVGSKIRPRIRKCENRRERWWNMFAANRFQLNWIQLQWE